MVWVLCQSILNRLKDDTEAPYFTPSMQTMQMSLRDDYVEALQETNDMQVNTMVVSIFMLCRN
jgi:hypothetical protein